MEESQWSISGFSQNTLIYISPAENFLKDLRATAAVSEFLGNFRMAVTLSSAARSVLQVVKFLRVFMSRERHVHEQCFSVFFQKLNRIPARVNWETLDRRLPSLW